MVEYLTLLLSVINFLCLVIILFPKQNGLPAQIRVRKDRKKAKVIDDTEIVKRENNTWGR